MMTLTIIPVLCPFHDPNDLPELFYAPVIDCAATQDIVPKHGVCPAAELHAPLRFDAIADRDDDIKIVEKRRSGCFIMTSVEYFDRSIPLQFSFSENIPNMISD